MFPRSLKTELHYIRHRRKNPSGCEYCTAYDDGTSQLVGTHGSMMILKAKFPYARWDNWKVGVHLLIIPIRHTTSFASLDDSESVDMMHIIKEYEADGYSFYIRAATNRSRTMAHVHGHLIKSKA
ncbi:MAG: HIT domain-containing protein [Patescibacteria group bacterium]